MIYGGQGYVRTLTTGGIPVWQGDGVDLQNAQGGFLLDLTGLVAGQLLMSGTPMMFDESTRLAKALTVGKIVADANATATVYQVTKSIFTIGQNFAAVIGGKAFPITAIDNSNPAFDSITVGTTIGAVTAGTGVFASNQTGATSAAFGNVNGLLYAERYAFPNTPVSVAIRGTIYARRIPFYSPDLQAALPHIIFSQSF